MTGDRFQHLVFYDGVCGLCDRLVRFVASHDRDGMFGFAPLQSAPARTAIARGGGDPDDLRSVCVLATDAEGGRRLLTRSRAVLFVAAELGWPWRIACVLGVLPTRWLDRAYDAVARSRYRLFGRYAQCPVPPPEIRARFVARHGDA